MTLVAIRHLHTAWNRAGLLQGHADIAIEKLTPEQRKKIRAVRQKLNRLGPFDAVICSCLRRTRQTAAAYGFKRPICEPLLDEFDFGCYERTKKKQLTEALGQAWIHRPHTVKLGESVHKLQKRIRKFLARYRRHERLLLFGHGCWLRALKSIHKTGSVRMMNRVRMRNGQVLVLRF